MFAHVSLCSVITFEPNEKYLIQVAFAYNVK
jgi:hypothetical protein